MLITPKWEWTVVCFTSEQDSVRGKQFGAAMKFFRFVKVNIKRYMVLGMPIHGNPLTKKEERTWEKVLVDKKLEADIVFTHNTKGDYGCPQHVSVNKIAHKLYDNVWEFACPGSVKVTPQPFRSRTVVIPLSQAVLDSKTEIFNRCHVSELLCWKNMPGIMHYEFKSGPELFTQGDLLWK